MTLSATASFPRLLGDIGGTNARFAIQPAEAASPEHCVALPCADFSGPQQAIEHYLKKYALPAPRWLAFGIATALDGDRVAMTNNHWDFSLAALQAGLHLDHVRALNDFTALALSLPALRGSDLQAIGGGAARANAPLALLGAGTGLGVSGLFHTSDGYLPIEGEGGHVSLAARTSREAQLIERIAPQFAETSLGHVSAERALSGPGLEALYQAVAPEHVGVPQHRAAAEISALGVADQCPACREALDVFCALLGTVAGDLALTLGARGGVYIGGGIVPRLGAWFASSPFRARFEDKGRFGSYLRSVPTQVIHAPFPAILGAALALEQDARRLA